MKIISTSPLQTRLLGLTLAKKVRRGCIFALLGDLGGGKTELTKGLARGLGIRQPVTSPTFVLMRVYRTRYRLIRFLCHVDVYKLKKTSELFEIGLMEFLGRPDSVVVIEWANKIKPVLKQFRKTTISFSFLDKRSRAITITKDRRR